MASKKINQSSTRGRKPLTAKQKAEREAARKAEAKKVKEFWARHFPVDRQWENENAIYIANVRNYDGVRSIGGGHSWHDWN